MSRTWLFLALLLVPSIASAQEIHHLYRPYGFRLPILSAGEYVLSAFHWDTSADTEQPVLPDATTTTESFSRYVNVNGVMAITDRLLVQGVIRVYPEQTVRKYETTIFAGGNPSTIPAEDKRTVTVVPEIVAVLRPAERFEISGSFYYDSQRLERSPVEGVTKTTIRTFSVGATYFGKI